MNQEPSHVYDHLFQLGSFVFTPRFLNLNSDVCSSVLRNSLYFDGFGGSVDGRKLRVAASLSLGGRGGHSGIRRILNDFNRFVRFHCERIPIGFASLGAGSGDYTGCNEDHRRVALEEGSVTVNGVVVDAPKRVLILMSDTGGGHRASAEAIRAAFSEEFGDEYQVFVTDLWSDHTPWPFNQLPRSYNFLVKHGPLWKMTYYGTAPRLVHQTNFAATSTFIARMSRSVY